jgi:hypothetical protein
MKNNSRSFVATLLRMTGDLKGAFGITGASRNTLKNSPIHCFCG